MTAKAKKQYGFLAQTVGKKKYPLAVLKSNAGFYIGTLENFFPFSRESHEYFKTEAAALKALETGQWTQRQHP